MLCKRWAEMWTGTNVASGDTGGVAEVPAVDAGGPAFAGAGAAGMARIAARYRIQSPTRTAARIMFPISARTKIVR
jgi:hypothetical protein